VSQGTVGYCRAGKPQVRIDAFGESTRFWRDQIERSEYYFARECNSQTSAPGRSRDDIQQAEARRKKWRLLRCNAVIPEQGDDREFAQPPAADRDWDKRNADPHHKQHRRVEHGQGQTLRMPK
jgi:hypothetical protein